MNLLIHSSMKKRKLWKTRKKCGIKQDCAIAMPNKKAKHTKFAGVSFHKKNMFKNENKSF